MVDEMTNANGHGGIRAGSGAKRKPLAEKILTGRKNLQQMSFEELESIDMPEPKEYLAAKQRDGKDLQAMEIYKETWQWLDQRRCAALINPQLLEQYSMAMARWMQCEGAITEYGFISKHPTTGAPIASPFVAMSQNFRKQALNIWVQIFQVVKENCSQDYNALSDDPMERLLSRRPERRL